MANPVELVLQFEHAINSRNPEAICSLMAWRAVVKDNKIAVWQVFADNEPIRAIMRRYSAS